MARYAIVDDASGDVLNVIEWDGAAELPALPAGASLQPYTDEHHAKWGPGEQIAGPIPPT
jgi:hypothetical protein